MMPVAYQEFLRRIPEDGRLRLVQLYHAVRNIPYGAAGMRDPVKVIENNAGSCSGKHLLLRDLLRAESYETEVITIYTHFNKGVPLHESYSDELARMIREENVCDFHHYVRARIDGSWFSLDATWHDALAPYGFPVNKGWDAAGDTVLAAEPLRTYADVPDVATLKQELIASLSPEEREKRARFFTLLTGWIAALPQGGGR